jgi:hypothetical protein
MRTDRTLADAEQQWIAKYRAALNQIPVQRPRFATILSLVEQAKKSVAAKVARVFSTPLSALPQQNVSVPPSAGSIVRRLVRSASPAQSASKTGRAIVRQKSSAVKAASRQQLKAN